MWCSRYIHVGENIVICKSIDICTSYKCIFHARRLVLCLEFRGARPLFRALVSTSHAVLYYREVRYLESLLEEVPLYNYIRSNVMVNERMEPSLAFKAAIFITSLITRFIQEVTLLS